MNREKLKGESERESRSHEDCDMKEGHCEKHHIRHRDEEEPIGSFFKDGGQEKFGAANENTATSMGNPY